MISLHFLQKIEGSIIEERYFMLPPITAKTGTVQIVVNTIYDVFRHRRHPRERLQRRRRWRPLDVSQAVQVRRRHRRLPQQEVDRHPQAVSGGHDRSVSFFRST